MTTLAEAEAPLLVHRFSGHTENMAARFKGEHRPDDIYTVENTRPIDVLVELFTMLRKDALYGMPGTDGTFWNNVLESMKNDNDVVSIFYLNKGHSFNKLERIIYLAMSVALNLVLNSYVGTVEAIPSATVALVVSVILVIAKKFMRFVFEAPCLAHDHAASDLRDTGKTPDELVKENERRENQYQQPVIWLMYMFITSGGVVGCLAAYTNFEIAQYLVTLVFNVIVFAIVTTSVSIMIGGYSKQKEAFQKKWGALQIDGKYVHPTSISDVAAAIQKHGGDKVLEHLDTKSQENWDEYFAFNDEGKEQLMPESIVKNVRAVCACVEDSIDGKYLDRFDGEKRIDPYSLETKSKLYGKELEMTGACP